MKKITSILTLLTLLNSSSVALANRKIDAASTNNPSQMQQDSAIQSVRVSELYKHPEKWLGKKVTIHGEVEDIEAPNLFTLDGEGMINDEITVVSKMPAKNGSNSPLAVPVAENEKVEITGKLNRFAIHEVERSYSLTLDPKVKTEFEGTKYYFVADSIRKH